MSGSEDHESSSLPESASPGALPSGRSLGSAGSGQEEYGEDRLADRDTTPPPLGVKLTVYRMLNMTILLSFGIIKAILTYKGKSTAPTTLDWVSGTLLAAALYWIGLYEGQDSKKWEWLFRVDLAPAFGYCAKRIVGGVLWPLVFENSLVVTCSLCSSLNSLVKELLNRSIPHISVATWLGIISGITVFVLVLQYCVDSTRNWAWQWAMSLVADYGPGAPLAEQYWWFGAVGTAVGLFCGIALVIGLPVAAVCFILYIM